MNAKTITLTTAAKIDILRTTINYDYQPTIIRTELISQLDHRHGVLLFSDFEYPGRYTRWDIGFIDPPIQINASGRKANIIALNARGNILLKILLINIENWDFCENYEIFANKIEITIKEPQSVFTEEQRSRQYSIFSFLRALNSLFKISADEDLYLGLYGSLGYNLAFQFEALKRTQNIASEQRDLVLYLPDRILIIDHQKTCANWLEYDFQTKTESTVNIERTGVQTKFTFTNHATEITSDHAAGEYADTVSKAKKSFKSGDLFEVVPGINMSQPLNAPPSEIAQRLMQINPSPYGFFMNLGKQEYLIGTSPEMFVRTKGRRVETCPISGTIKRVGDAIGDAKQILTLLKSEKEESELTMCSDVDRNDKARICEPGSVKVIGRRQIEIYSHLIHTVDHVEGQLRPEFDSLDAFLTHTWAVTVTGAPKKWAMQFIEDNEKSPRHWYGGAVGCFFFNGNINTGLTLRTIQIKNNIASIRAGATLLYDSDPLMEEQEIMTKATAMLNAIAKPIISKQEILPINTSKYGHNRILLIDHEDSFVHMLADYFRQTGAKIDTIRFGDGAKTILRQKNYDLVVLSPGPGKPSDFAISNMITLCLERKIPIFGICLGLQAIGEYFGASLAQLDYPIHGKSGKITIQKIDNHQLFNGINEDFTAARYHSLYIKQASLPEDLQITALSQDDIIMGISHKKLPIWAVQFHPESILTLGDDVGIKIIRNVVKLAFQFKK